MDKDRLAQRLMATFLVELESHVRAFEQGLLALERDPTPPERAEIFGALLRTAHTLKGAARSVKVDLLEIASHRLEEIFTAARNGERAIDRTFFNLLLPAIDAFGDVGRRLASGGSLADAPLADIVKRLSGETPARPEAIPSADPMRVAALPPTRPVSARPAGVPPLQRRTETARVASHKLDALLRQSGELLVVRHRAEARTDDIARLQDNLAEWRREWRSLEQRIAVVLKEEAQAKAATKNGASIQRNPTELAVNRCRDSLLRLDRNFQRFVSELAADRRAVEQTAGPLDASIRQARMFPFAEACEALERTVRDLCTRGDKKVDLVIEGGEIELDRMVLESIRDPLLHLVRNAVDHGIEPMAARRMAGKPVAGRLVIAAALRGTRVEVTVRDDGKGLDLAAVADRLRKADRPVPGDERELMRSIFLAGLSTAPTVTEVSGRGVGLDVVKTQLTAMRGTVDVGFVKGGGTVFTLNVPLTLTSIRAVLLGVDDETYAIDTASIERVIRVGAGDMRTVGERDMVLLAGQPVPVIALAEAVGRSARPVSDKEKAEAVILSAGGQRAAVLVDALHGEREVIVRALGPRLRQVAGVAGGTILPSGRIALILNPGDLVERATTAPSKARLAGGAGAAETVRRRLLVVDDSATIRTLEKSILEAAGYDVVVAADGQEAWQLLLEVGADLVVSDVEMPRMDGFSLTETIRASNRFRDLPVILVTALESEADKARGLAVGATAYRMKSAFDQKDLLATIERIL